MYREVILNGICHSTNNVTFQINLENIRVPFDVIQVVRFPIVSASANSTMVRFIKDLRGNRYNRGATM